MHVRSSYVGVQELLLFKMVDIIYIFFVMRSFQVKRLSISVICTCFINSNQELHLLFNVAAADQKFRIQSGNSNNLSQTVTQSTLAVLVGNTRQDDVDISKKIMKGFVHSV